MITVRRASDRGRSHYDWLESDHTSCCSNWLGGARLSSRAGEARAIDAHLQRSRRLRISAPVAS